jgi:hypothetical protein
MALNPNDYVKKKPTPIAHAPIHEVAGWLGIEVRPNGQNGLILCPFHKDTKPSCILYTGTNTYKCFACGVWGDDIALLMGVKGLDFAGAQEMIKSSGQAEVKGSAPKEKMAGINKAAPFIREAKFCYLCLKESTMLILAYNGEHNAIWSPDFGSKAIKRLSGLCRLIKIPDEVDPLHAARSALNRGVDVEVWRDGMYRKLYTVLANYLNEEERRAIVEEIKNPVEKAEIIKEMGL